MAGKQFNLFDSFGCLLEGTVSFDQYCRLVFVVHSALLRLILRLILRALPAFPDSSRLCLLFRHLELDIYCFVILN